MTNSRGCAAARSGELALQCVCSCRHWTARGLHAATCLLRAPPPPHHPPTHPLPPPHTHRVWWPTPPTHTPTPPPMQVCPLGMFTPSNRSTACQVGMGAPMVPSQDMHSATTRESGLDGWTAACRRPDLLVQRRHERKFTLARLQACRLGTYWDGFGEPSTACKVRQLRSLPVRMHGRPAWGTGRQPAAHACAP